MLWESISRHIFTVGRRRRAEKAQKFQMYSLWHSYDNCIDVRVVPTSHDCGVSPSQCVSTVMMCAQ